MLPNKAKSTDKNTGNKGFDFFMILRYLVIEMFFPDMDLH
jgi:hypothetical protein